MIPQQFPLFVAMVDSGPPSSVSFVAQVIGWVREPNSEASPRFWPVICPLDHDCPAADTVMPDDRALLKYATSREEAERLLAEARMWRYACRNVGTGDVE